jgi:hypothetical protein
MRISLCTKMWGSYSIRLVIGLVIRNIGPFKMMERTVGPVISEDGIYTTLIIGTIRHVTFGTLFCCDTPVVPLKLTSFKPLRRDY